MCLTESNDSCAGYDKDNRVPLSMIRGQICYRGWFWLTLMTTSGLRVKGRLQIPRNVNTFKPILWYLEY